MNKIIVSILILIILASCAPQIRAVNPVLDCLATSNHSCVIPPGDYTGNWIRWDADNVVMECQSIGSCVLPMVIIYGSGNTLRGFRLTDPDQKTALRIHGDDNLVELNEMYDTAEDGMWLWGRNNIVRNNYIHDIDYWFSICNK